MTRGAKLRDVNAIRRYAGGRQQIACRRPAVEIPVTLARNRSQTGHRSIAIGRPRLRKKPSSQLFTAESLRLEPRADVAAHLVAARADRRTRRSDEVGRTAAELARQRLYRDRRHARRQAAPAGVRRRDRAGSGVRNQQRHAVGRLNRERQASVARNDDVGIRASPWLRDHRARAVNLTDPRQVP